LRSAYITKIPDYMYNFSGQNTSLTLSFQIQFMCSLQNKRPCYGQSETRTSFPLSTSVFPCQLSPQSSWGTRQALPARS